MLVMLVARAWAVSVVAHGPREGEQILARAVAVTVPQPVSITAAATGKRQTRRGRESIHARIQ